MQYGRTASGFTYERHPSGIATERHDVLLHPFQGRDLIHVPEIADRTLVGGNQRWMREKAKAPEAIIQTDHYEPVRGEPAPVCDRSRGTTVDVATAVNPDHYRQFLVRRAFRGT